MVLPKKATVEYQDRSYSETKVRSRTHQILQMDICLLMILKQDLARGGFLDSVFFLSQTSQSSMFIDPNFNPQQSQHSHYLIY